MTSTPFSAQQKEFSDQAHEIAKDVLYPKFFGVRPDQITYEKQGDLNVNPRWAALDGDMAIDRILSIKADHFRMPIRFTVQERYRTPDFAKWQDITITEWNILSKLPSELYKLSAQYFVYGYFNAFKKEITEAVIVDVGELLRALVTSKLSFTRSCKKNQQDFIAVTFADLERANLLIHHYKAPLTHATLRAMPRYAPGGAK